MRHTRISQSDRSGFPSTKDEWLWRIKEDRELYDDWCWLFTENSTVPGPSESRMEKCISANARQQRNRLSITLSQLFWALNRLRFRTHRISCSDFYSALSFWSIHRFRMPPSLCIFTLALSGDSSNVQYQCCRWILVPQWCWYATYNPKVKPSCSSTNCAV